jgi:pimeloyl-ACP methyl ester carboxylesterase
VDGARSLANLVTFYQMKNRAGDIGQGGVHDALQRIRGQRPADGPQALRLHLAGHSFGARLVTAATAGAPGSAPLLVNSLTLLQAAFSHFAFAAAYDGMHDGFYRRVETDPVRVRGVTAITFTAKDKAVGLAYPLASRIARQIAAALGDANDPYGGLGRNGAQKTPGTQVVTLQAVSTPYSFAPRGIYNLDSNAIIGGHSDLGHDEVAYALISAMAAS